MFYTTQFIDFSMLKLSCGTVALMVLLLF